MTADQLALVFIAASSMLRGLSKSERWGDFVFEVRGWLLAVAAGLLLSLLCSNGGAK